MSKAKAVLTLTALEARVLHDAALNLNADVDQVGWSPAQKAAYDRAMKKLARASIDADEKEKAR